MPTFRVSLRHVGGGRTAHLECVETVDEAVAHARTASRDPHARVTRVAIACEAPVRRRDGAHTLCGRFTGNRLCARHAARAR